MHHSQVTAQINNMGSLAYWTHAHVFVRHLDDVQLLSFMLVLKLFGLESGNTCEGKVSA